MKITVIGAGYVGLVTAACFAEMGNTVFCLDTDDEKIYRLTGGDIPIYEPGLARIIEHNLAAKRLTFTTDFAEAIPPAEVLFICVGTPQGEDGAADLTQVFRAAEEIGQYAEEYTVAVTKSTVPVGTTDKVGEIILGEILKRGTSARVDMANNPEFLKEGSAVSDFMSPDRVVVGAVEDRVRETMHRLYSPFLRTDDRVIFMSIPSSELTKYASNAMLATRISFMNELALLAEKVGADIELIRQGIARDRRIGKYFLYAGAGYGGSCFPKDISALIRTGAAAGLDMRIAYAVNEVNLHQKRVIADKIIRLFEENVRGKKVAVWGLAFKPETDDVREAPAIEVIRILRGEGAVLAVHDPVARANAKRLLGTSGIIYHEDAYKALEGADVLAIMTEWKEYRSPDWGLIRSLLATPAVFDGRNLFEPEQLREYGLRYFGIGHGETI
ncbi:MAG: UDP-glucose dehydrogenase family protein [Candidatus Latescibacterota bacterium]